MKTGMFSDAKKIALHLTRAVSLPISLGTMNWRHSMPRIFNSVPSPKSSTPNLFKDALSHHNYNRLLRILVFCLLPLLPCACLTSKGSKSLPFRGLTSSEAEKLESQDDFGWKKIRPEKPEQEDSPEHLAEMAEIFLQSGDYEKSLYNYSKILSQNPQRHDIRYKLGLAMLLAGKLDEAKKELAEVLLHATDMAEAHETLGFVHLQENNLPLAQQEFRSALALEPKRFQSRYFLGETHLRANQYSQALGEFKTALEHVPRSAKVMSALGWTFFKLKNSDQGLQWLQKAKALDPNNPKLNHRLGMVLAAQKKFPEALEAFRKAGDEAQAFNNIGVHYYLDNRYAEAARCFQKALELRPTYYQEAKVNLDKALARMQDEKPAEIEPTPVKGEQLSWSRNQPTNNKDLSD